MLRTLKTRLIKQPYFLFLLTGLVLVIVPFFYFGQSIDLYLHHTYFIISINYFFWAISLLFFIAWGIYALTNRFLWTNRLTWTHVLTTIFVLLLLSTIAFWHDIILPPVHRDTLSFENIIDEQHREKIIAYPIMAIFVLGQAAYLVNLVVGLLKRLC